MFRLKRAYDPPSPADGHRVLVDRLWPRGLKKEAAALAEWRKDVAPSPELRRWFGHDPARFEEFRRRYVEELAAPAAREGLDHLRALAAKGTVTLVYAAKDPDCNHAIVLREVLEGRASGRPRARRPRGRTDAPRRRGGRA